MKAFLIRHGETDWNSAHKLQGRTDISINQTGNIQAVTLAESLRGYNLSVIVSSNLARAKETAKIIADHLQLQYFVDDRLQECSFGSLEGYTWKQIECTLGVSRDTIFKDESQHYDFSPFGGEMRNEVLSRHQALLHELRTQYPEQSILLVGHGTGLNTLLSSFGQPIGLARGEYRMLFYETHLS